MVNNIRNNTISKIEAKKCLNTLDKIKNAEIKDKRLIPGQKELLNLFDLLDTILTDKTLEPKSQENKNEKAERRKEENERVESRKEENENLETRKEENKDEDYENEDEDEHYENKNEYEYDYETMSQDKKKRNNKKFK